MSVLIKGVDMPERCDICPLVRIYPHSENIWCNAANEIICQKGPVRDSGVIEKPEWCPLVDVPVPHGRLIDANALHDAMYHRAFETDGDTMWQSGCWVRYRAIEQVHNETPTVIEAED